MTTTRRLTLAFAWWVALACAGTPPARDGQQTAPPQHPYAVLAPSVETRLRFSTEFSFERGPALQVKVYEWILGPRQELPNFPLEGFAAIEVKAGEIETTIGGATARRQAGDRFVVPEGSRLDLRVPFDTGRGDNLVSLQAVVAIRR